MEERKKRKQPMSGLFQDEIVSRVHTSLEVAYSKS